jgi:hypothetical protein
VTPTAHQKAVWNALTAPCASSDCSTTATMATPKEAEGHQAPDRDATFGRVLDR